MPQTIIKIHTWVCPSCDYHQDFDPSDAAKMALHFPNVPANHCPACFTGQNPTRVKRNILMSKENRPKNKITITIMGEEEVDDIVEVDGKEIRATEADKLNAKLQAEGKKPKEVKPLSVTRKNELKAKIRADITKFKALED